MVCSEQRWFCWLQVANTTGHSRSVCQRVPLESDECSTITTIHAQVSGNEMVEASILSLGRHNKGLETDRLGRCAPLVPSGLQRRLSPFVIQAIKGDRALKSLAGVD